MIPTYQGDEYLAEALHSVLRQAPPGAQIEVVDDCSPTGDPAGIVAALGDGRVGFHRQPANVGHTRNFNTCLRRARGELVHVLHGDDVVADGFYRKLQQRFEEFPEAGAVICRHAIIDEVGIQRALGPLLRREAGRLEDWLATIGAGQLVQPPAVVVKRSVYEATGGFDEGIERYGEDWEMWVRVAAATTTVYEPEPLALYRKRSEGSLSDAQHVAANMSDMRYVIRTNRDTMAAAGVRDLSAVDGAARTSLSAALLRRATRVVRADPPGVPLAMVLEAVRTRPAPSVVAEGLVIVARGVISRPGLWARWPMRVLHSRLSARSRHRRPPAGAQHDSLAEVLAHMPPSIAAALDGTVPTPLSGSTSAEQHPVYRVGTDRVLHVYGPPAGRAMRSLADRLAVDRLGVDGVPPVHAAHDTGPQVWLLEQRATGEPADVERVGEWFPDAVRLLEQLAAAGGPPLGSTAFWRHHAEAATEASPAPMHDLIAAAWQQVADLPATVVHGNVRPENLLAGPTGVELVGWEGAWRHGLPGLDLLFLALTSAPRRPDPSVIDRLLDGGDPPGRSLLQPLAAMGVDREHVRPTIIAALSVLALDEEQRAGRTTQHRHHPTPLRALLEGSHARLRAG